MTAERHGLDAPWSAIRAPGAGVPAAIAHHLDRLTKPPGSLGRLEDVAHRLAMIYGDPPPPLTRKTVYILAADHGVAARGVSAYPAEVTAQMCANYAAGGAAINVIARAVGAKVVVADVGVDGETVAAGVRDLRVRRGTRDLASEPALTVDEVRRAIDAGVRLVDEDPPDLVALGEMGIGNTTAASAMTVALTGADPAAVVGRGTGVDDAGLTAKHAAVRAGVARLAGDRDPMRVLAEVGGLEIAGLVGVTLAAARHGRAVVTDGFIATAAVLAAVRLCPSASGFVFASHRSQEPGHQILLETLGLPPLLDLDLRLGEGTGAALALPLVEAAGGLLREMATFASAGVSESS